MPGPLWAWGTKVNHGRPPHLDFQSLPPNRQNSRKEAMGQNMSSREETGETGETVGTLR